MTDGRMTKHAINHAIYLSKLSGDGYCVYHEIAGESIICEVPSVAIGNCIVRALRQRQMEIVEEQKVKAILRKGIKWRDLTPAPELSPPMELRSHRQSGEPDVDNITDSLTWTDYHDPEITPEMKRAVARAIWQRPFGKQDEDKD